MSDQHLPELHSDFEADAASDQELPELQSDGEAHASSEELPTLSSPSSEGHREVHSDSEVHTDIEAHGDIEAHREGHSVAHREAHTECEAHSNLPSLPSIANRSSSASDVSDVTARSDLPSLSFIPNLSSSASDVMSHGESLTELPDLASPSPSPSSATSTGLPVLQRQVSQDDISDTSALEEEEPEGTLGTSGSALSGDAVALPASSSGILGFAKWAVNRLRVSEVSEGDPFRHIVESLSNGPLRVGSLCSGIDTSGMCFTALECALGPTAQASFVSEVLCEIDESKRAILRRTFCHHTRHVYADVHQLADGKALDLVTERICDPSPNFLVVGFSCKDLSSLSNLKVGFNRKRSTSSGSTFFSASECVRRWKSCELVVLENVHGLLRKRHFEKQRPVDIIDETFRRLGFLGSHRLLNTMDFGFPQRRQRCWMVYFRGGCGDFDILWGVVTRLRCQCAPTECFLEDGAGGRCFSARLARKARLGLSHQW